MIIIKNYKVVKELKRANRYDDIIDLLNYLSLEIKNEDYPVDLYISNGKPHNYVSGIDIKREAKLLLDFLQLKIDEIISSEDELFELEKYVDTSKNILMINYTNALSHRIKPETDLDEIRILSILTNLINNVFDRNNKTWNIPEGWAKHDGDGNESTTMGVLSCF